jgi:hypothetical protein
MFGLSSQPAEATTVAFFVRAVKGSNAKGKKTGAMLNWVMQRLVDHRASHAKGFRFMDRGLFFSKSRALGAKRWLKKAKRVYKQGLKSYASNADAATSAFRRASTFYHYAHPYYMTRKRYQSALLHLAMLQYQKKENESAWRHLSRGILLQPKVIPAGALRPVERKIIEAGRCKLANGNRGNLTIKTKDPAASVFINDQLVGFGTLTLRGLPAGEYYITVQQDGFRRWGRRKLRLQPGASKTVYARNFSSPQRRNYEAVCNDLMPLKEGEQLTDKLKDTALTFRVQRLWFGCFKPDASGEAGDIHWFTIDKSKSSPVGKRGTIPMPSGLSTQVQLLSRMTSALGFPAPSTLPTKVNQYVILKKQGSCPNLSSLLGRLMAPVKKYVIVYTKYGFRIQGKLLKETASYISVGVAQSGTGVLKEVRVPSNMVRFKWQLGPMQQEGFRIGERIVVQTIYGISTIGRLVSIDVEEVAIKTRYGVEKIKRGMIKKMVKRDR